MHVVCANIFAANVLKSRFKIDAVIMIICSIVIIINSVLTLQVSTAKYPMIAALVPDGRIQGRWTQKWPSKISCGLGSQRPRKRPNSKFPNYGLIVTLIGKNWPKNL